MVQVEGQVVMLTLLSVILPFIPDAVLLQELKGSSLAALASARYRFKLSETGQSS